MMGYPDGPVTRKRDYYLRSRDRGRRRLRTPLPEGFLLGELAALAGVRPRSVRYYVERDLLPRPEFRGTATRYTREHLLRIFAIQKLQREEHIDLDEIRMRLAAMSPADLEKYAPPAPATHVAGPGLTPPAAPTYASESWERVALLPGLELCVRADASPLVRRLVQEIHDHCVGSTPPPAGAE
jgi:DNA-binding transcriptional MerR regulator